MKLFFIPRNMLTKNTILHINQLKLKKNREEFQEFIAEGTKLVCEFLESDFLVKYVYANSNWIAKYKTKFENKCPDFIAVSDHEMERISQLKSASEVLAVISFPDRKFSIADIKNELSLVLDTIQDPGNLGTIIRTADWFGIRSIFCSENTVDVYNPKVVQATMGSLSRVNIIYTDILNLLKSVKAETDLSIYGTFMEGKNIFEHSLYKNGIIIIGSEGSGISNELFSFIDEKLFIPSFQCPDHSSESLNVSIATGIICAEFRRRK